MEKILVKLPLKYREHLEKFEDLSKLQELRFRRGQKFCIKTSTKITHIDNIIVSDDDLVRILEILSNFSVHSIMESLKNGYFTVFGANRVSVCGTIVNENTIKNISSINIRIANEFIGIADEFIDDIIKKNILIISPPGYGKTSLIREIIRKISNTGAFVSVADDRGEICSGFDVGENTDILIGGNKLNNAMMMIRTMSPQYIAIDEITQNTDIMQEITDTGVYVIATAHSLDLDSAIIKYSKIIKDFDVYIVIKLENGLPKYEIFRR